MLASKATHKRGGPVRSWLTATLKEQVSGNRIDLLVCDYKGPNGTGVMNRLHWMEAGMCTRFVYLGGDDQVVTGRSMDWKTDIATDLWAFPQAMQRSSSPGSSQTGSAIQ